MILIKKGKINPINRLIKCRDCGAVHFINPKEYIPFKMNNVPCETCGNRFVFLIRENGYVVKYS